MASRRSPLGLAALVTLATLAAAPAAAQTPPSSTPAAPLAESLRGDAKAEYDAGKSLYDSADFAGAMKRFEHAYALSKDPRLFWNMAACEKQQRQYGNARKLALRFQNEAASMVTPEYVQAAKDLVAALDAYIGGLHVGSNVAGADVLVDGEKVGVTPLDKVAIDDGQHTVTVRRAGYQDFVAPVDVQGRSVVSVDATMKPEVHGAHLIVNADANAVIAIDGTVVGSGRYEGDVTPGDHAVRVTREGMKPKDVDVRLADHATRTLDVVLEKRGVGAWPWIAGGAAVVIGGAIASYFIFKPGPTTVQPPVGSLPPGQLSLSFAR